jgi:hypothetical protein
MGWQMWDENNTLHLVIMINKSWEITSKKWLHKPIDCTIVKNLNYHLDLSSRVDNNNKIMQGVACQTCTYSELRHPSHSFGGAKIPLSKPEIYNNLDKKLGMGRKQRQGFNSDIDNHASRIWCSENNIIIAAARNHARWSDSPLAMVVASKAELLRTYNTIFHSRLP